MSVREYIGARYVPLFADPIEWDNTKTYEPLTIVYYQGNSYTSRQAVPTGIAITNETYWALTGNYNAQIEAYRTEVQQYAETVSGFDTRIDAIDNDIDSIDDEIDTIKANNWVTTNRIADSAVTSQKIAANSVTADKIPNNSIPESKLINDDTFIIFGDSWGDFTINPNWATPVNDILGCGNMLNYCTGGATFVYNSSNTVSQQIQNAKSTLTTNEKNNVKYILIMAGVNDHHPTPANGLDLEIISCIEDCKNNFPNAVIQWFPTSCAPDYDNGNGPKWLYCIATFWHVVSTYQGSSNTNDPANRYCFPKTGAAFYFNQNADVGLFFNSTKLHLSNYGKNAIVNSILQGFGKCDFEVYKSIYKVFTTGRPIITNITPTSVQMFGDFAGLESSADISYGISGQRIAAAMAGQNCERLYQGLQPHFLTKACMSGTGEIDGFCSIRGNSDWTSVKWQTNKSFNGATRYIPI